MGNSINDKSQIYRKTNANSYKRSEGDNVSELRKQEEIYNRKILRLEVVIGLLSAINYLIIFPVACFAIQNLALRIFLIMVSSFIFIVGISIALKIEQSVGYYECQSCRKRYVPKLKSVYFAIHKGRTRYMKCPCCGKRTFQKKTLSK